MPFALGYLACGVVHALTALALRRQFGEGIPPERVVVKALGLMMLVTAWPAWLVWTWRRAAG